MERLFSSPGLYCRKKLTGREMSRIIMLASTPREVFVSSRCDSRLLADSISSEDRETHRTQMATPIRALPRPLLSTGPVNAAVICGISIPTSVTANVESMISTRSLTLMHCFMYSRRSGMPIFRMGSGR